ncbi:MAG: RnfH family protein [Aquisalimonadaceae bacterium]
MESPTNKHSDDCFPVEVAYGLPEKQILLRLNVPAASTVRQAIEQSGLLRRQPEVDLAVNEVGIFGRLVSLEQTLCPRDRVEIYRPLIADPKEVRRQRARRQ